MTTRRKVIMTCTSILAFFALMFSINTPCAATSDPVDVEQPGSTYQVLPKRCVGDDVMPVEPQQCRLTDYPGRPTVVLWGDSHSWQITPAVQKMAEDTQTNLVVFERGACPPVDVRNNPNRTGLCVKNARLALEYIEKKAASQDGGRPVTVIMAAHWHLYRSLANGGQSTDPPKDDEAYLRQQADLFAEGGGRAIRTVTGLGARLFAVAQQPTVPNNVANCPGGNAPYQCDIPRNISMPEEVATDQWLLDRGVMALNNTTQYSCDATTCSYRTGSGNTWIDALHRDPAQSSAFAPAFTRAFNR